MEEKKNFTLAVVGPGAVGKSCFTINYVQGGFSKEYDPTIHDSYRKEVQHEGKKLFLEILDTAGQDDYDALRDQYMRESDGFLVVYDITSSQSFESIDEFVQQILRVKEGAETIPMVLVGNKIDLEPQRQVKHEEATNYAKNVMKTSCHLTASALEGKNVVEAFNTLISMTVDAYQKANPQPLDAPPKKKKKTCTIL